MDVQHVCDAIQQKVTLELHETADPGARSDILIEALYQVSRLVLPELGYPKKSEEYQERQGRVLDLITFLAIPLIRTGFQERRGVAVLSEIAEGCHDPLLKKKFSVYAQELLARSRRKSTARSDATSLVPWLIGCVSVMILALYLSWPNTEAARNPAVAPLAPAPHTAAAPAPVPQAPAHAAAVGRSAADPATTREASQDQTGRAERSAAEERVPSALKPPGTPVLAGPQGEQAMRVRIVNNQVLVPVTLKNGSGTIRVELLLDTGATRTAIHEGVAVRLPIDLSSAKSSQAVVADGRVIRSRVARIDALVVGPFAMTSPEVELIPYHGEDNDHDGLLGMDFLARHRYHIDMEHQMIRWF